MATQAEAIKFLKSNYQAEDVGDNLYKVVVDYEDNRSQLVFVGIFEHVITLNSPFASEDDLSAKQALTATSDGLFGLKQFGTLYTISNLLFVEDLDPSEFNKGIHFLAKTADDLEKSLVGGDRL